MKFWKKENVIRTEVFDPQKDAEKVTSPERLDVYLQVANPGMLFLLAAVVLVLGGFLVWGIFGDMEEVVPITIINRESDNGLYNSVAYVEKEDVDDIETGMKVVTPKEEGAVMAVSDQPEMLGNKEMYRVYLTMNSEDGIRDATGYIILEEIRPIAYIIN